MNTEGPRIRLNGASAAAKMATAPPAPLIARGAITSVEAIGGPDGSVTPVLRMSNGIVEMVEALDVDRITSLRSDLFKVLEHAQKASKIEVVSEVPK